VLALEADAQSLNYARSQGFIVEERIALQTLGLSVVRLRAPGGERLRLSLERLRSGDPNTAYDYNHIYRVTQSPRPSAQPRRRATPSPAPAVVRPPPAPSVAIGMIDGPIAPAHPSLRAAAIEQRVFARGRASGDVAHGTAVASLLVGQDRPAFAGGAPGARLFAGAVVSQEAKGGDLATADAMVRALDWLTAQGAAVINISMAGPPNALVEDAVKRTQARGAIIVAAVGNDGPAAPPRFPAAYDGVVGVTAVDSRDGVYRRAGRGQHVDLAAPGVDVAVAVPGAGYAVKSGTSFAAPHVAAALAQSHRRPDPAAARAAVEKVAAQAADRGDRGKDPVYGAGIYRPGGKP
jgi:subtilisin family serine protease